MAEDKKDVKITSIKLNDCTVTLNNCITLSPTITPNDASNQSLTWSSKDESVAAIVEDGIVKGIKEGKTTITAIANDGSNQSDSCEMEVVNPQIIKEDRELVLPVGFTVELIHVVDIEPDQKEFVVWSSSEEEIAKVDKNGKVETLKSGNASIKYKALYFYYSNIENQIVEIKKEQQIKVVELKNISIVGNPKKDLLVNKSYELGFKFSPEIDINPYVKWSSSDDSVATIDLNGKVTAKGEGKAIITLANENGRLIDTCEIYVKLSDESITLNSSQKELCLEDTFTLTVKEEKANTTNEITNENVTWESSEPAIATVEKGKVTAKGVGTAVITATYNNSETTCIVTVPHPIELTQNNLNILVGGTGKLAAKLIVKGGTTYSVTWAKGQTDGSVKITSSGNKCTVIGEAEGEDTVIAKVTIGGKEYSAECKVEVSETKKDLLVGIVDDFVPQYDANVTNKYTLSVHLRFDDRYIEKNLVQGESVYEEIANKAESFLLTEVSFHKEIYRPGFMEVTIKTGASLSVFDGMVTLTYNTHSIAKQYYIFEKKKKRGHVMLRAYSVDKFLTIDKFCRAFTAKKLVENIVIDTIVSMQDSPNFKQYYTNVTQEDTNGSTYPAGIVKNLHHLSYTKKDGVTDEAIIPYSVQYNESFYDFLVRMCNRNGEFLYCEDDKLYIGVPQPPKENEKYAVTKIEETDENDIEIETNESGWEYQDNSQTLVNNCLKHDSLGAVHGEDEFVKIGKTDIVANDDIYPDDYFERIYNFKSYNVLDDDCVYAKWSDYLPPTATAFSLLKTFADTQQLNQAIVGATAKIAMQTAVGGFFRHSTNEKYRDVFFKGEDEPESKYEFASESLLLTSKEFYKNIFEKEELAKQKQVVVTCTTCQAHKLGDIVEIDNNYYVVYQIKGGAKLIDSVLDAAVQRYVETYELLLLPVENVNGKIKAYPLPMPEQRIRKSAPQRAKVVNNFDPKKLGRIRVAYPWQSADDTNFSPWLRVSYPMASGESGFMFFPKKDDEVLIDYEGGNIERPFMVGSFYNEDNRPSVPAQMQNLGMVKSITSENGHHISFTDIGLNKRFLANLVPFWSLMNKFTEFIDTTNSSIEEGWDKYAKYLAGGFEIADYLGVYTIKGTTHDRNITISSPVGDIKLDAFTGITIDAPLGDIKITGKNVSIEARNNLTLTSGTNIDKPYFPGSKDTNVWKRYGIATFGPLNATLIKTIGLDLSFHRTWLEIMLRPIGGTLLIKSYRYMKLEAGKGQTQVPTQLAKATSKTEGLKHFGKYLTHGTFDESIANSLAELNNISIVIETAFAQAKRVVDIIPAVISHVQDYYTAIYIKDKEEEYMGKIAKSLDQGINATDKTNDKDIDKNMMAMSDAVESYKELKRIYEKIKLDNSVKWNDIKREVDDYIRLFEDWMRSDFDNVLVSKTFNYSKNAKRVCLFQVMQHKVETTDLGCYVAMNEPADLYNENALLEAITLPTPTTKMMFENVFKNSALNATGLAGMKDDRAWSVNDQGGILISADKGQSFKLTKEGKLQNNYTNVVEKLRDLIRRIQ